MRKRILRLNKKQVSSLNDAQIVKGGVQSEATNCMSPAICAPPAPQPVSYTYCTPNNGPCYLPGKR
ncbi:hypothetical protein U8527_17805 [Kordia algicida OT-1]|uniref:Class I lanthipeptide n=1 Tax=Kordia algicida OT-1 TaxID=391587 RepID=A9DI69_9FLAO|nr:hypothetical protein [Kordia algicida]EDP97846.1 hypothetical protein KAOT1_11552 [Kordia algicida OT-1]